MLSPSSAFHWQAHAKDHRTSWFHRNLLSVTIVCPEKPPWLLSESTFPFTAFSGGTYGLGTVFQLRRCRNGKWIGKVLYSFRGEDGNGPRAGLISDTAGNLYGTTAYGGSGKACGGYGCGTVLQLKRGAKGIWIEKVLHSFKGEDGSSPYAGLTFDAEGNLYGTTAGGGDATFCQGFTGCGVVFQLVWETKGVWMEKVLHIFRDNGTDGTTPVAGVISDAAGNLYGTTEFGGSDYVGTVFQLTLGANGKWTEKLLHTFVGTLGEDGLNPAASLIFDSGNLYGTTAGGGAYGCGAIFEITQ